MFLTCPLSVSRSLGLIEKPLNSQKRALEFFGTLFFLLLTSPEESIMFMGNGRPIEMFIRLRGRPRPMAVDECEEDNPVKPCAQEGMLRRIPPKNMGVPRALPVWLHREVRSVL